MMPAILRRWRQQIGEAWDRRFDPLRVTRRYLRLNMQWNSVFVRGRALDIGCGSKPYAALFKTEQYIGIDMPPYTDRVDVAASGLRLPFADGVFDSVLCTEVLEHVPEPAELMAEAARVLRPGGYLLLTTPQTWGIHLAPHDYYRYTPFGLRYLAEKSGLQVVHAYATTGFWVTFTQRFLDILFYTNSRPNFGAQLGRLLMLPASALQLLGVALDRLWGRRGDTLDNVLVARRPALPARAAFEPIHHDHFCTYFDQNYLSRALALYQSLDEHCERPFTLWALCFDDASYEILEKLSLPHLRLIRQSDFEAGDSALAMAKADRSRKEYYWTCTPSLILYLFAHNPELPAIAYVDSDLFFFADPQPIFAEFAGASVLLVEHRFGRRLLARLDFGIFNVGLLVFRRDANSLNCLRWWRDRCLEWCKFVLDGDRFADQKYLDQWPANFPGVVVASHPGVGVAPWNVMNYDLGTQDDKILVDGHPMIFYHFHNFRLINDRIGDPGLEDYGAKLSDAERRMYTVYGRAVIAGWQKARQVNPAIAAGFTSVTTGGYGRFVYLSRLVRRQLVSVD